MAGSTLLEVLVSMTLIVTTISLFFLSAGNIKKIFNNDIKIQALTIINSKMEDLDSLVICDDFFDYSTFKIRMTISPYNNSSRLFEINISALSSEGKTILSEKRILLNDKPRIDDVKME